MRRVHGNSSKLLKLILDYADLCGMLLVVQLSPYARQRREEHENETNRQVH